MTTELDSKPPPRALARRRRTRQLTIRDVGVGVSCGNGKNQIFVKGEVIKTCLKRTL